MPNMSFICRVKLLSETGEIGGIPSLRPRRFQVESTEDGTERCEPLPTPLEWCPPMGFHRFLGDDVGEKPGDVDEP